jgi:hypothetical protein
MGMPPYGEISHFQIAQLQEDGLPPATEEMFDFENQPALEAVWDLMQSCWELEPSERPDASELLLDFGKIVAKYPRVDEGYMSLCRERV